MRATLQNWDALDVKGSSFPTGALHALELSWISVLNPSGGYQDDRD
jgi:hypothetical protein